MTNYYHYLKGGEPKVRAGVRIESKLVSRDVVIILAPLILFACCGSIAPAGAILNCFTPNMFKMNKGAGGGGYQNPYGGAERANWYPQSSQLPYQPNYSGHSSGSYYGHNPMKLLFQPKWRGASLFGSKGWSGWKMGANSNFYRPGYGYGGQSMALYQQPTIGGGGYQQFSDQLSMVSPHASSYPTNPNEGWTVPVASYSPASIQQTQLNNYDSTYTHQPAAYQPASKQQLAPILDPYSTKGGVGLNEYAGATKKSILLANGYNLYNSPVPSTSLYNKTYGYAYPDWYSGAGVESPAKIAQQLMKYNLKRQHHQNRSAPLILGPLAGASASGLTSSKSQFTILDEPRFVGFGTVDSLDNKEARLSCSFNEAIDQTNRPLWIKFLGPYNSSRIVDYKVVPPFNCANSQCRTQEIESTTKDYRYKFDNGPATSTLIIGEPRLSDYGTYRCSALTKAMNNNPLETIYQIVQFGIV